MSCFRFCWWLVCNSDCSYYWFNAIYFAFFIILYIGLANIHINLKVYISNIHLFSNPILFWDKSQQKGIIVIEINYQNKILIFLVLSRCFVASYSSYHHWSNPFLSLATIFFHPALSWWTCSLLTSTFHGNNPRLVFHHFFFNFFYN